MPPVVFEPTIPASARQQTYALDRMATGIGLKKCVVVIFALVQCFRNEQCVPKCDEGVESEREWGLTDTTKLKYRVFIPFLLF
jgi:hypothetical protein